MRRHLTAYFRAKVYPLLTPLAFDPGHPFPLVSNRSKNFAVAVRHQRRTKFARVKVPDTLPRFIEVPRPEVHGILEREAQHAAAGRPAHVIIKCNAVTDPAIVRALYRASQAGVRIDTIVSGVCALKPGIPEVSETIHVRSVVGRFLEHSCVYCFANGGSAEVDLGSADLMERNPDRRVETLCRVGDAEIADHLRSIVLDAYLRDCDRAYVLTGPRYERACDRAGEPFSAQQFLLDWYRTTPLAGEES